MNNLDIKFYKNIKEDEVLDINMSGGNDNFREGVEIVERNNIACIIKHPTEEKFLISKWKKVDWNGFVTGGIEEGDTVKETAEKEIKEETGYINIKNITETDYSAHGLFYHVHKGTNRLAHYKLVIVELADLENIVVSEDESEICDFVWIAKDEVLETLTRDDMKSLWRYFLENYN